MTQPFRSREVDWENLDKFKFYAYGIGIFSGVTTCLYPLTVIKTRNIVGPAHLSGLKGVHHTITDVWRNAGFRGFYKGFGTVCVGTIPARIVYMSSLELGKSNYHLLLQHLGLPDSALNGVVNFCAGATASMSSQTVFVPVDVVSQRLMVLNNASGSGARRMHGYSMMQQIVRQEGFRGLWKGFFTSIATYVPSSAIWWGSYGFFKQLLWSQLDWTRGNATMQGTQKSGHYLAMSDSALLKAADSSLLHSDNHRQRHASSDFIAVQTSAALLSGWPPFNVLSLLGVLLAGVTSAFFTTPLDVVKTRTQLAVAEKGKAKITAWTVCRQIVEEQGISGFMRGFVPRAANVALWGTCMVSAYEFIKRNAATTN